MTAALSTRLPPGGSAIPLGSCLSALRRGDPEVALREGLAGTLGAPAVTLHASGREALRVALAHLAARTGRREVVVPGYACFSIAAAAVAAGLRVRLVDVTSQGALDVDDLARIPFDDVAAVVVCNLFGLPEAIAPVRRVCGRAGAFVIDDAAQALGSRDADGPVGGRGDVGLLSFGRGKPLSALGGGGLAWSQVPPELPEAGCAPPRPLTALARAVLYDLARLPWVFGRLAAIPALRIGETPYDPGFRRGAMDGASLCLAAGLVAHVAEEGRARERRALVLARRLSEESRFRPLVATDPLRSVYPRLGVLAPSASAREAALASLARFGATRLYPTTLAAIPALRPHLAGEARVLGAQSFCERLLTLPTHRGLAGRRLDAVLCTLGQLG